MDQDRRTEVIIDESSEKVSAFNALQTPSTKKYNKGYEFRSKHVMDSRNSFAEFNDTEAKEFQMNVNSFSAGAATSQNKKYPLDIELLLRLYACNSNMDKSIQRVMEEAEERNSAKFVHSSADEYQKSLTSSNFPPIELGAAYKLIHFLKESCCKNPISSSYCDILLSLRKIVSNCNNKRLKSVILNDPSLKMCEQCGVLSCSKSQRSFSEKSFQSHNKPYYLNVERCCDTISNTEKEQGEKLFSISRLLDNRFKTMDKEMNEIFSFDKQKEKYSRDTFEEDNLSEPEKDNISESQKVIQPKIVNGIIINSAESQVRGNGSITADMKINEANGEEVSRVKLENRTEFDVITDVCRDSLDSVKYSHEKIQSEQFKTESVSTHDKRQSIRRGNSKSRDVEEERSVSNRLQSDFNIQTDIAKNVEACSSSKRNTVAQSVIASDKVRAIADRAKYLARSPFTAAKKKGRESISQLDDATSLNSKHTSKEPGLILHRSWDNIPQIETFSLDKKRDELLRCSQENRHKRRSLLRDDYPHLSHNRYPDLPPDDYPDKTRSGICRDSTTDKRLKSGSLTWSMENDSLENCTVMRDVRLEPGESDTTGFSSSSAENLMREWLSRSLVKEAVIPEQAFSSRRSITADASSNILDNIGVEMTSPTKEIDVNYDLVSSSTHHGRKIETPMDSSQLLHFGSRNNFPNPEVVSLNPEMKLNLSDSQKEKDMMEAPSRLNINDYKAIEALKFYQEIFEDTQEMDWENFQVLVERIHPRQTPIWRDICEAISKEAQRATDEYGVNTKVCIEISPVNHKETKKEDESSRNEVIFEMDITLEDVESFLGKKLTFAKKEELDTYQKANGGY